MISRCESNVIKENPVKISLNVFSESSYFFGILISIFYNAEVKMNSAICDTLEWTWNGLEDEEKWISF